MFEHNTVTNINNNKCAIVYARNLHLPTAITTTFWSLIPPMIMCIRYNLM